jgi:hypothetical protein
LLKKYQFFNNFSCIEFLTLGCFFLKKSPSTDAKLYSMQMLAKKEMINEITLMQTD